MSEADRMLTLKEIRERYQDEWVLVDVTAQDELKQPTEGRVLVHDRDRDVVYDEWETTPAKDAFVFFTGDIVKKGYVAML